MLTYDNAVIELLNLAAMHKKIALNTKEGSRKALRETWSASALYYALSQLHIMDDVESDSYKHLAKISYYDFESELALKYEKKNDLLKEGYEKECEVLNLKISELENKCNESYWLGVNTHSGK